MDVGEAAVVVSSIAILVSVGTLIVAVCTLRKVSSQTELLRRQVFGEVYDQAQILGVNFFLPAKEKHLVKGFEHMQNNHEEILVGYSINIPTDLEIELHIKWVMAESQTLRSFIIGFADQEDKRKPEIIQIIQPFKKFEEYTLLPRDEYIDWSGYYHCEYGYTRRLAKGDNFVTCLVVRGWEKGKHLMDIEIQVSEAPKSFRGKLEVNVVELKEG